MADDKDTEKKKTGAGKATVDETPAKKPVAKKPPVDEEEEDDDDDDEEEEEEDDDDDEAPARPAKRAAAPVARGASASGPVHRPGVKSFLPWAVIGMGLVGAFAYIEKPNDIRMHATLAVLGISFVIYAFIGIGSVNEVKN